MSLTKQKKELIHWAQLLNQKGFIAARSGNISCKVSPQKILLTTHDCYLGYLEEEDILLVDLEGNIIEGKGQLTSETKLHLAIQKKFPETQVVLHAHSPYTTAFFNYFDALDIFSFESRFYLGDIKAIPQDTPTVIDTEPVLNALENNAIVILKNHGVVTTGNSFKEAFSFIELLEEQARVNLMLKCISKGDAGQMPVANPGVCQQPCTDERKYRLLSSEHINRLVELVNNDEQVQELGKKYDLTCSLAVKNQDTQDAACFYYDKGRIIRTENTDQAEFVIIGQGEILKKVFNRKIDPFVASTQSKVKTKGDFSKMSKWYPVLVRTFKLWEQAPVY